MFWHILLIALGCLVSKSFAVSCSTCHGYTAAGDTDCGKLKKYISCTFIEDKGNECTVPSADKGELTTAIPTCNPRLDGYCKCEADFYTAVLDDSHICDALDKLKECIEKPATQDHTCDVSTNAEETKSNLLTFVDVRKRTKCPTTPNQSNVLGQSHTDTKAVCAVDCKLPKDADAGCESLETYVDCVIKANKPECFPKSDELKTPTGCTTLKGTCKCETDYFESDLTTNKQTCGALKTFNTCLSKAEDNKGCKQAKKEDIQKFVNGTIKAKKCASGNGVTVVVSSTGMLLTVLVAIFSV